MTSFARRAERVQPSAIREFLALAGQPGITSFAGGYPDPTLFPMRELHGIYDALLTDGNASALQYTASEGLPELRALVAARLSADGMPCTADDVLITQGGQQGLDLTAKLFVDAGDVIVTERPTFLGALIAFNPCEPDYRSVPMDDEGMDTDALEQVLRTTDRVKLVYTVPDHQNPTGRTMSLARRRRLVELAEEFDVVVLEDTPYRELRYEGERLPTIKSLDTTGRVVHLGSFSKILAPGLRLGWALAEPEVREKLALLKLAADTQNGTLNMRAAAAYLGGYDIEGHIAGMLPTYRHQRDLMLASLQEHFPPGITWTRANGGLFTWVTFPAGLDMAAFQRDVLIPQAGVIVVPGTPFFADRPEANHARMSYSGVPDDRLVEGVRRMGALLTDALR
ncbi:MAG TPA: PLP-dependent aminotransferase family protein [Ornithinibacter sp.]|jgi:2-aminoadipate transaminase|nr:PLP-dependent aminotransferase family protein [Ornithinibacter sp.]HOT57721.1 PLP-dependent aminotransferase family protein [Ornithinibacter sp.]HPV89825.1 PLP-dependent aminotransferase family protein [Ornithinibacter sp.]HQG16654.1 PLP-dependent aminotransferase family protein [Ornithinibacter sp.]HQV82582.1 PLP-dependent aminotransferase family protein [Ornithinibacter sp.]